LTAANSYGGPTIVNSGALALSGGANRLPTGTIVTLGTADSGIGGTLNLNGNSQMLAGIQPARGNSAANRVVNGSATAATLTVNNASPIDRTVLLGGSGENNFSLVKQGSGSLPLAAGNTYAGSTTISGGSLMAYALANGGLTSSLGTSSNAAANLVLDGGTLEYVGSNVSTDRPFSVGTSGGTINVAGTGAVNFTHPGAIGYHGQSGPRTLTLTGTNIGSNTLSPVIGDSGGATSLVKAGTGQ
jgi:fibronectin-binding autotransporter adhesin